MPSVLRRRGAGLAVVGLLLLAVGGCTSSQVYRAVYDALHAREEIVNPAPSTGAAARRPDYAVYEAERQRLRDERGRATPPADRGR